MCWKIKFVWLQQPSLARITPRNKPCLNSALLGRTTLAPQCFLNKFWTTGSSLGTWPPAKCAATSTPAPTASCLAWASRLTTDSLPHSRGRSGTVWPVVDVIKLFWEEISISPKLRNWKTFVLMSEPVLNVKTMLFSSQTMLNNCLLLLKWPILFVLA